MPSLNEIELKITLLLILSCWSYGDRGGKEPYVMFKSQQHIASIAINEAGQQLGRF